MFMRVNIASPEKIKSPPRRLLELQEKERKKQEAKYLIDKRSHAQSESSKQPSSKQQKTKTPEHSCPLLDLLGELGDGERKEEKKRAGDSPRLYTVCPRERVFPGNHHDSSGCFTLQRPTYRSAIIHVSSPRPCSAATVPQRDCREKPNI